MRELPKSRDPREISVAGETRSTRPAAAPRRRPAAPAGAGELRAALRDFAGGLGRLCRRHPGEVVGSLAALGAAGYVALNALGFQDGRHPAPILPKIAARQDVPAKKPVPEKAAQAPAPAEARAEAPRPKEQAPKEQGQSQAARDPIGALIRADDTTASVTPKSDRAVLQAQRALSKLGYGPIKADGLMGSSTRAAIEKFERDRKLPVKGEAAGRTLRELAARAGLPPG